jgi:hypothetical protein
MQRWTGKREQIDTIQCYVLQSEDPVIINERTKDEGKKESKIGWRGERRELDQNQKLCPCCETEDCQDNQVWKKKLT